MSNLVDIFDPVVAPEKRHPAFEHIRIEAGAFAGRTMIRQVFEDFHDKDGNFVREFQTAGFDARIFELYLFAYFRESGYEIDDSKQTPDFVVQRDGVRVGIEATTSSRPDPFSVEEMGKPSGEEIERKQRDEMPVRLGSPLFSKLQKKYWELPHMRGLPFVIAIEAFHDTTALHYPSGILANYLYGLEHFPTYTKDGALLIQATPIATHDRPGKEPIPSNFFGQPDAEHVSAVLFCNSGTWAKFNRMGYIAGHQRGDVTIIRTGLRWNSDPNAATPVSFKYDIRQRPTIEPWGEGLAVFHNPSALVPLPRQFFQDAADSVLMPDNQIVSLVPEFHPYMSQSIFLHHRDFPLHHEIDGVTVEALTEYEFDQLKPIAEAEAALMENFAEEREWLADRERTYIASILHDFTDDDWNYVVLTRDANGVFRPIEVVTSVAERDEARSSAARAIASHNRQKTPAAG